MPAVIDPNKTLQSRDYGIKLTKPDPNNSNLTVPD
jgi:hypothetical protein